ncbi:MAG: chromosomal replication initiator protein DnaA [Gammaproteobacteria bacterium]|nr:chromosomal replication initiator protein DnaA [Gammaproteobacteria bacterium]
MTASLWSLCLKRLERELSSQEFNTWIRPLHAVEEVNSVSLLAPNRFVLDRVKKNFLDRIVEILCALNQGKEPKIRFQVGSRKSALKLVAPSRTHPQQQQPAVVRSASPLNPGYTFQSFVIGKSNRLAHAAARQAVESNEFNPLLIYGGVGLGKTHLIHAVGNMLADRRPAANVVYLHSERFVADMVKALQSKAINEFKRYYRSADALLIDDVQFLAGKTQSQEEFFHTFNALIEGQHQVMLTCDRMPNAISGLETRLKSRFGSGLTVAVGTPDLNTRIEILLAKAKLAQVGMPEEVAMLIARHIDSGIRELEGALHRLAASAKFMDEAITLDFSREALKDLLVPQARSVSIGKIQQTVAEYYKISVAELNSKRRLRRIVRPRQIAISLAKELTQHSLPEIGSAFGGRERTTVLHSCKTVAKLKEENSQLNQDYQHLQEILSHGV